MAKSVHDPTSSCPEASSVQMTHVEPPPPPGTAQLDHLQDVYLGMHQLATTMDELHAKLEVARRPPMSRLATAQLSRMATAQLSVPTSLVDPGSFVSVHASWLKGHNEVAATVDRFGPGSWQAAVVGFIHSHSVQVLLSGLLVLDIGAVFLELFLEAHYPECHIITRDAVSCCKAPSPPQVDWLRRLASHAPHHSICVDGLEPSALWTAGCDAHKWPLVHTLHAVCRQVTFVVLGIFLAELLALVAALRRGFLRKRLYVLDLVIVLGTLGLECFHQSHLVHTCDPAQIMILARCWRFIRVGHGLVVETHERDEKEVEEMRTHCQDMAQQIQLLRSRLEAAHISTGKSSKHLGSQSGHE